MLIIKGCTYDGFLKLGMSQLKEIGFDVILAANIAAEIEKKGICFNTISKN